MKKIITSCWLILIFAGTFAQAPSNSTPSQHLEDLKSAIAPSPTAASIAKYAEWPVNLYNGTTSISIPVYTLKGRDFTVPITINYHSSGIKVSEVASWVGLGWSLNAGGVITRSVKGLPDDFPNGVGYLSLRQLYLNPGDLASGTGDVNTTNQYKVDVADGKRDSEPDYFTLNALGQNFKLFFKGDGTIVTVPYSKVKVTADFVTDTWTVILEDGTQLTFGGEYVEKVSANRNWHPDVPRDPFATAWYLKKITSVNGEIINFGYSGYTLHQDNTFFEEDEFFNDSPYGVSSCSIGSPCNIPATQPSRNTKVINFQQNGTGFNLSFIENDECRIDFVQGTSERLDFQFGRVLAAVKILSKQSNQYIRTYNLEYTYSGAAIGNAVSTSTYHNYRLKLVSLTEKDVAGNSNQKWQFQYNPTSLPSIKSFAQDHWGYFNGATTNTTLLPQIFSNKYVVERGFDPDIVKIGNRHPSATHMQAEMLTKIIYPTGGYTNFEYEPNNIPVTEEVFQPASVAKQVYLTSATTPFNNTSSVPFTVTKEQYVKCTFSGSFSANYLAGYGNNVILARCKVLNSLNQSAGSLIFSKADVAANGTGFRTAWFYVAPGTYTLEVSSVASQNDILPGDIIDLQGRLDFEQSVGIQPTMKFTGGLRIRKIEDFDAVTNNLTPRIFTYEQPFQIQEFRYDDYYLSDREVELDRYYSPDPGNPCQANFEFPCFQRSGCYQMYLVRSSAPKSDIGDNTGATVGYEVVRESKAGNGYTVNEFLNVYDENIYNAIAFPFPIVNSKAWQRGQLISKKIYNNSDVLLAKTDYQYELLPNPPEVTSFKAGWAKVLLRLPIHCFNPGELAANVQVRDIFISSGLIRPKSITQTEYKPGMSPIVNTINLFYDNPINLSATRVENINSKGENIKTIYRFPLEKAAINLATPLSNTESTAIDQLIIKNVLSQPLQSETYNNSTLISRNTVTYKNWNGIIVKPEKSILKIQGNEPFIKAVVRKYDNYGNMLERQGEDLVIESFIWGYGGRYLVAKIVNKTYDEVVSQSGIDVNIVNNLNAPEAAVKTELSKLRTVAGCMVTTYLYKPLIGMVCETNPNGKSTYYEYDNFGRLAIVRDNENNIINKYCYNFAGQPENCSSPCFNISPNWQNTATPPVCQQGSCGNTGYQLQEQRDMNTCSPTYNQTQTVLVYNPTACVPASGINVSYQNTTGIAGFTATYTNLTTLQVYTFSVPASGTGILGCVPAGAYSLNIAKPGNNAFLDFGTGCSIISGTSAFFKKGVQVGPPGNCNQVTIGVAF